MKKVVMILNITMIGLTTIDAADNDSQSMNAVQPDDENNLKLYLAVGLDKVPDQSDGVDATPDAIENSKKFSLRFSRGRVKSMDFSKNESTVRRSKSIQELFPELQWPAPQKDEKTK